MGKGNKQRLVLNPYTECGMSEQRFLLNVAHMPCFFEKYLVLASGVP